MTEEQRQPQDGLVIGIDLHPECLAAVALIPAKAVGEPAVAWQHPKVAFGDWARWLARNVRGADVLVLEAGCNTFAFVAMAEELGLHCVVLDSRRVGQIAKAYCKNDKGDAYKVARAYLSGMFDQIWVPDARTRQRRETLSRYQKAVRDSTRARNCVRSWLTEHGLRLPEECNLGSGCECAFAWIQAARPWTETQRELLDAMFEDVRFATAQRKRLLRLIGKEVMADPDMLRLLKICGINLVTSYALMASIGTIHRFPDPKKLAAYVGLVPRVKESGQTLRSGGVGAAGNRELRADLVEGAQSVLRSKCEDFADLRRWGLALWMRKRDRGLAAVAVARKMVVAVWHLLKGHPIGPTEPTRSLGFKINSIVLRLGADTIKAMGYPKTRLFKDELFQKILATP
ncbi:MAG: IS110 family transposase [Chloroflexi bacterium]|nr:IS110 family transposase [Chloroflexota bacterium]